MKVFLRLPPSDKREPCALTIGNFDGVHRGHQALVGALVADARRHGLLSCVLTFEPHPREFFAVSKPDPVRIANLRDKLEALAALEVDRVCVAHFNQSLATTSARDFVSAILVDGLRTRRLLVGDDFRFGARRQGDFNLLTQMGQTAGMDVRAMPTVVEQGQRVSSSLVRQALGAADFARVAQLLGRPYRLSGRVIHGRRLGRELGFPTLNLRFPHGRPAVCGVFVVRVHGIADGARSARPAQPDHLTHPGQYDQHGQPCQPLPARPLFGVASLGTRPAVEKDGRYLLEVHLLDWSGNAYGKLARVEFLHKIRDEEHFHGLEALTRKIEADVDTARDFLAASQ